MCIQLTSNQHIISYDRLYNFLGGRCSLHLNIYFPLLCKAGFGMCKFPSESEFFFITSKRLIFFRNTVVLIYVIPYHHNQHRSQMLHFYCVCVCLFPSFLFAHLLIAHIFLVVCVSHLFFVYFSQVFKRDFFSGKRDVNLLTWYFNHH